jgi:hypothetical protein
MDKIIEGANGHSFAFDVETKDFEYVGADGSPDIGGDSEIALSLSESYFLSGNSCLALNVYSDGSDFRAAVSSFYGDIHHIAMPTIPSSLHHNVPICLCGPICKSPSAVSEFCRRFPNTKVYACNVVDELPAFGRLLKRIYEEHPNSNVRPRRICFSNLIVDDEKTDGKRYFNFATNLPNECYAKLGECVGKSIPAVNTIRDFVGISPFYGRIISTRKINEEPIFLISMTHVDEFFPTEAISVKNYAATSVPVRVKCGAKFKEHLDIDEDQVTIFVLSSYIEGQVTFGNFYQLLSGKVVSMSFDIGSANIDNLPVFTSNRISRPNESI